MSRSRVDISETPFSYESGLAETLNGVAQRVRAMRASGALTPEVLSHIRRFFRVKNIYHSNAIEENQLSLGETELVVREGMKRRRTSVLQPEDQIGRIYQMGEAGDLVGLGRQIDFRPLTAFTSRLGQRYIRCAVCLPRASNVQLLVSGGCTGRGLLLLLLGLLVLSVLCLLCSVGVMSRVWRRKVLSTRTPK